MSQMVQARVMDPVQFPHLYPPYRGLAPKLGDFVKLIFATRPGATTEGLWVRVTGFCRDGTTRGRMASKASTWQSSYSDEVRFNTRHVVDVRPPKSFADRAAAWMFKWGSTRC